AASASSSLSFFSFFQSTAPTYVYTLSLHDALPIYAVIFSYLQNLKKGIDYDRRKDWYNQVKTMEFTDIEKVHQTELANRPYTYRSEEHTSELQSRENLVCRLLLEKKKKNRKVAPTK